MAAPTYTYKQFQAEYPTDDACLLKLMSIRYGGTELACPACKEHSAFHLMSKRKAFACQNCGHHIYPCAETIFHKSRTKLTTWFFAMYLMTTTRHGVAAKEIERQTGVTYKCAWRICHQLRLLMAEADGLVGGGSGGQLKGHVEVDETFYGKNTGRRGSADKAVVFGAVERGGRLRAKVVPNVTAATLTGEIDLNIETGSRVSSDEFSSYRQLRNMGYDHQTVEHTAKEYVRGDVHTNTLDGHWSRLKNSIRGTHIHVSQQHLDKYVGEFNFRYNMRKQPEAMFRKVISSV